MALLVEAVLFDLDGTLLNIDMDVFLPPYLQALGEAMKDYVDPQRFGQYLMAAVTAMIENTDPVSNEDVFWASMQASTGLHRDQVGAVIDTFYTTTFPELASTASPISGAKDVVQWVASRFKHVVLATNPIFPEVAVKERLRWAGLDVENFTFLTTYEAMHACKPQGAYYRQISDKLKVPADRCVMVGNDKALDIEPAARLGMKTYFVSDGTPPSRAEKAFAASVKTGENVHGAWESDSDTHRQGSLQGLIDFLSTLV